ncbi:MAG TPA: hypothetical protein DD381_04260 [Lentisphaeria bacterium]|nr:MAG: hypothetical protein A2X47_07390 [Lentisphaerae bacterium GWF2_38_69]HBM15545.1 hypothetical protein [Lentisphaeria bacterium]
MPGRDGTGPMGRGAMTGGGFGYCQLQGKNNSNIVRYGRGTFAGRCIGRGLGTGRGFKKRYFDNTSYLENLKDKAISEKQFIEERFDLLMNEIESLREKVENLSKGNEL